MSYHVVAVKARSHNNKHGNVVDASVVKLRHERTGQTISLIKGIPTREHGAYVILVLNPTGQRISISSQARWRDFVDRAKQAPTIVLAK
jgi:hypothetical protein